VVAPPTRSGDGTITVGSRALAYVEYPGAGGHPVVLLHGYTAFPHDWDDIGPALAGRRRVVAMGLAGHGDSDWLPGAVYCLDGFVDDVVAQVAALGLEHFDLIGHSMGGAVAISFASQHPRRVRRLVLEDAGPIEASVFWSGQRPGVPVAFANAAEAGSYLHRAFPGFPEVFIKSRLHHALEPAPDGSLTWRHDREGLVSAFDPVRIGQFGSPLWSHVAAVRCPTLVIRADPSTVFPKAVADAMITANPHFTLLEVPGADHRIHVSHRGIFLDAVTGFLGDDPRPGG
jgi:esterase